MDDCTLRARLITRGRRSGQYHTVRLTAVVHGDDYYFSRHRPDSDWFLNALANPDVVVEAGGHAVQGTAVRVHDPAVLHLISSIKYPGQARAADKRVAIRVTMLHPHTT